MNSTEVAKIAGVSRSTVSRVINGYPNVPKETFEKVMEVVREHNYYPNNSARTLAGKPSSIIGIFFVDNSESDRNIIRSSPFYTEFLAYFTDKIAKLGYALMVSILRNDQGFDSLQSLFNQKMISCGVFMGDIVPNKVLKYLSDNKHYSILINQREHTDFENIILLNTENYLGSYKAVELLIKSGHTRIAHIAGTNEKISTKRRLEGYKECLLHNGLPFDESLIIRANIHREESGYQATQELIQRTKANLPSAIFAANDLMAISALQALNDMDIRVPDDVSLIGYDNVDMSKYTTPTLSTVSTPLERLAELASVSLTYALENDSIREQNLLMRDFDIVARNSIKNICK